VFQFSSVQFSFLPVHSSSVQFSFLAGVIQYSFLAGVFQFSSVQLSFLAGGIPVQFSADFPGGIFRTPRKFRRGGERVNAT